MARSFVLRIGRDAYSAEALAGSVAITGADATLTVGAVAPTTGLDFPGRDGGLHIMFGWSQGANSGLDTVAPFAAYPATYIRRVYPRNDSPTQLYFSDHFHANDESSWSSGAYKYYGTHQYKDDGFAADNMPSPGASQSGLRWEISVAGNDWTGATVTTGQWYVQVTRARIVGSTATVEYFWNWPSTTDKVVKSFDISGVPDSPDPIICHGGAPWNPIAETYDGILRGIQHYNAYLSDAEVQDEIDSPGSAVTPWYLKLNPAPDEISDDSGNGHDPAWVNANRPTLWEA